MRANQRFQSATRRCCLTPRPCPWFVIVLWSSEADLVVVSVSLGSSQMYWPSVSLYLSSNFQICCFELRRLSLFPSSSPQCTPLDKFYCLYGKIVSLINEASIQVVPSFLCSQRAVETAGDKSRKLARVCKQWPLTVLQCQWFCQTEQHFLCAVSPCSNRETHTVSSQSQWSGRNLIGLYGVNGGRAPFPSFLKRR